MSFAIFQYNMLQWKDTSPAYVGFNGTNSTWKMPCSMTENIVSLVETSNVGEEGVWLFRIDQDTIEPACRDRAMCGEDQLCSCLIDNNNQQCLCKNTAMSGEDDLTCNVDTVCPDNCIVTVTQTIPPSETPCAEGVQPSDGCSNTPAIVLGVLFVLATVILIIVVVIVIIKKLNKYISIFLNFLQGHS
ncbi:hypothetical protein GBAR_LOCUS30622 [Geodia barretti]|nr:hypothetical protein GBAR_LOCUS30622 [Geodia barretti]